MRFFRTVEYPGLAKEEAQPRVMAFIGELNDLLAGTAPDLWVPGPRAGITASRVWRFLTRQSPVDVPSLSSSTEAGPPAR